MSDDVSEQRVPDDVESDAEDDLESDVADDVESDIEPESTENSDVASGEASDEVPEQDAGDAPREDANDVSREDAPEEDAEDAPEEDTGDATTSDRPADGLPPDRPEHLTAKNFLSTQWRGHDIAVSGDWTLRWLYLTPTYTLWVDGNPVESLSGPRIEPSLDAVLEDETGEAFHLNATLTSIVGYKPPCKISIEEEVIAEGDLRVANFINPFLVLFILIATGVMIYVGPDVLAQYAP